MGKHIQLTIPQRCHENWEQMKPLDQGRFCSSCQKQVTDFTTMNDEQLAAFFKKPSTGSVCGRFMQDQLDRTINIPKKRIPWVKYFFQFALPAFLLSAKAAAQGKVLIKADTVNVHESKKDKANKTTPVKIERRISGKVIDANGTGVAYASVLLKGTTIGVATDSTGNFALKYYGSEDSIVLVASSIGFEIIESTVDLTKGGEQIAILLSYNNTLGEVVVAAGSTLGEIFAGGVSIVTEDNIIDTICSKIFPTKQSLTLYPNPVKTGASLTIKMDNNKKGSYLLQVATVSGQVVYNKEMWLDKNDRFAKIDIPKVAAGIYLVSLVNKQSGKTKTEKFTVE